MKKQQAESADAGMTKQVRARHPSTILKVCDGKLMQGHPSSRLPDLIPQVFAVDGHCLPLSLRLWPWLLPGWCLLL